MYVQVVAKTEREGLLRYICLYVFFAPFPPKNEVVSMKSSDGDGPPGSKKTFLCRPWTECFPSSSYFE